RTLVGLILLSISPLGFAQVSPNSTAGNTAHPGGKLPGNVAIQLTEVAGGFVDPIHVASPKDGTGRLFVCERPGVIRIIDKSGKVLDEPFFSNIQNTNFQFLEQGLYCIAFDPKFKENGLFYVSYADMWFNGATFIVRYKVSATDPTTAAKSASAPTAISTSAWATAAGRRRSGNRPGHQHLDGQDAPHRRAHRW